MIRRHLHGELAVRREQGDEAREEALVIADPVQCGVGEDEIEGAISDEAFDFATLEAEHFRTERLRLEEHRLGAVDPDRLLCGEVLVQRARQLARAAAEVDDAHVRPPLDQRGEIVKRLRALVFESLVLGWVHMVPAQRR